jgi:hypothetical protein
MQTSNYLPYAIDKGFSRVSYRGGAVKRFYKKHAHKRERQAVRESLHSGREMRQYKWWVTGWDID